MRKIYAKYDIELLQSFTFECCSTSFGKLFTIAARCTAVGCDGTQGHRGKGDGFKAGWKKIADPGYAKNTVWVIPRETDEFLSFILGTPEVTPDKITMTVGWQRKKTPIGGMIDDYVLRANRVDLMISPLYSGTVEIARGSDGWKVESLQSDVRTDFGPMAQP